jgi:beta-lactamase regulating signal transducer with metallopeptidase domain/Tfp pilus assembly protein PilF
MNYLNDLPLSPLLILLARVTVVALIGRLLLLAIPRASAAVRYLVSATTLCSMLAMPVLAAFPWRIEALPAPAMPSLGAGEAGTGEVSTGSPYIGARNAAGPGTSGPGTQATAGPGTTIEVKAGPGTPTPWQGLILLALIAGATALIIRTLLGLTAIATITSQAREIEDDTIARDFDIAREQLGVGRFVRLLVSDRVSVPLMWGIFRPALLLPSGALEWSRDRLRIVLLHELAHLRRHDAVTLLLTRAATSLFWFHPLAWALDGAARRDCEQACDDLVLATGTRPSDYADHLLAIARTLPQRDPFGAVTLAMSRRPQLEGRLLSILQPHARRGPASRRGVVFATLAAALFLIPIGTIQLIARPGDLPRTSGRQTRNPQLAEEAYTTGKHALNERDYARAIQAFDEAVRNDPYAGSAWYNMACAYALSGDRERALQTLEQAVLHNFGSGGDKFRDDDDLASLRGPRLEKVARLADELELRSFSDDKRGNDHWRQAIEYYVRVAREHPEIARAWFNLGYAQVEGGDPRGAIDSFGRALQMNYRIGTVMYNLGCANSILGNDAVAVDWLHKAADAGFDVGGYAKGDRDLDGVRDNAWVAEKIAEARAKHDAEKEKHKEKHKAEKDKEKDDDE